MSSIQMIRPSAFETAFCARTTTSSVLELDELRHELGEVVAFPDLGQAAHGDDLDHSTPVTRTPACAL